MDKSALKSKLRIGLRDTRRKLESRLTDEWDNEIFKNCLKALDFKKIKRFHVYLPMPDWREVDTWQLIKYIWQNYPKIQIFAPKIAGREMESLEVTKSTELGKNSSGITEPEGKPIPKGIGFDVIIIPTLGFDDEGYRLGSGSGHYDRFLSLHKNSKLIGLCYEIGHLEKPFPHEPHDLRLHQIITENKVYRF